MRILLFAAGGDIGGGKTHIVGLAKELSKNNELRLVCFRVGEMSKEAKALGIDTVAIDVKEGWHKTKKFAFDQAREFKPDVIHCHGSKANLLGVLVKRSIDCPVMTTVHSDPKLDYMASFWRRISYGNLNAWALRHMDHYTAVSDTMRRLLVERGFNPQHIGVVNNGIDFSNAPLASKQAKGESETITIGIAARLNPVKDVATTIRAFELAYQKDKRLRLSIAGIGEEEESLKALAKELGIDGVVSFAGWISDIKAYFSDVDINVISSVSEGFPYSIVEGAYMHCPTISTNVGGIPALVEHEKNGLLFEPGDVNTFAEYIIRLAGNDNLRREYGDRLFAKAKEFYSLEKMALDQLAIYETAIRIKKHSGRWGTVLCGAYGKGNAGDEAILKAILGSLRSIDCDMPIYVMSRKPEETKLAHYVNSFFTFDVLRLSKALKHTKLFISGGGTLIQDVTSTRSLMYYLYTIKKAKKAGCKVDMYGCGIGPITKEKNKRKAANIIDNYVDVITLRDSLSLGVLKELNVTKPTVVLAADPTVNLPAPGKPQNNICDGGKIIFCLRPWGTFKDVGAVAKAAMYAYQVHGLTPVFIPMEYPRDVEIGEQLGKRINIPHFVLSKSYSFEELRSMLSDAELVVGMRLHSLVFAASAGVPILALSYDIKVDSFIKDSGAKRIIQIDELTADKLIENIDLALYDGRAMGEETKQRLKELEKQNSEYAARLLGE